MLLNACKKNEAKIGSVPDLKEQGTELEAILQYQTVLDRMLTREPRTGKQKLLVIISSMQGVPAEDQEGGGTEGRGRKVPSLANWLYTFVVMHKASTDRPDRAAHHWRVLSIDHVHSIEKPTTLSEGSLPLSLTSLSLSLSPLSSSAFSSCSYISLSHLPSVHLSVHMSVHSSASFQVCQPNQTKKISHPYTQSQCRHKNCGTHGWLASHMC